MYKLVFKRIVDVVGALVLLVVSFPFLVLVALLVKATSSGSIFFLHERVGKGGRNFLVMKFRTYFAEYCGTGENLTVKNDDRVTPVGKTLRMFRLDELPQLVNVLKGEMSLVGPRPEVEEFVARYSEQDKVVILSVLPGITGRTQLRFHNEEELLEGAGDRDRFYREQLLPQKIASDREYAENVSLRGDFLILLETVNLIAGQLVRRVQSPDRARKED